MKTKMKKLLVATIALLTVGSGVILTNNIIQENLQAETTNTEATALGASTFALTKPTLTNGKQIAIGGIETKIVYNNGSNTVYAMQNSGVVTNQTFAQATNTINSLQNSVIDTKAQTHLYVNINMPSETAIREINGGTLDNNKKLNQQLLYMNPSTEGYWVGPLQATGMSNIVRSDGVYNPPITISNENSDTNCHQSTTYYGAIATQITAPAKTYTYPATNQGKYRGLTGSVSCAYATRYCTSATKDSKTGRWIPAGQCEDKPTGMVNQAYYGSIIDPLPWTGTQGADQSFTYKTADYSGTPTLVGYKEPRGRYVFIYNCVYRKCYGNNYYSEKTGTLPIGLPSYNVSCASKTYTGGQATARALVSANLSSVVFASSGKSQAGQITGDISTSDGAFLTASDPRLVVNGFSSEGLPKGYTVADNKLKINSADVTGTTISIPIDVKGSAFQNVSGYESTPVVAIAATDNDGNQVFGRATTAKSGDTLTATLDISNLAKTTDGVLDAQELDIVVYNNELISKGGNQNYVDYISDGVPLTIAIGVDQNIEFDNSDSYKTAILDSEEVSLTAHMLTSSVIWDTATDFEIDLGAFKDMFDVTTVQESYISAPAAPANPYTGEKGKVSYKLKLKSNTSFTDGDEVTVKIKKLATANSGYLESNVLVHKFKLYHPLTDTTVSAYDTTDTKLSKAYGSVTKDTKLFKVTMDYGLPGQFNYSLEGSDAELFQIAAGDKKDCTDTYGDGTPKDCAIITAKKLLDYKASAYDFTVKVENYKNANDTYKDSTTDQTSYTITKRALSVKPTLSKTSGKYKEALPTIGFETISPTSILASDTDKMGKFSYHYEDSTGTTVSDMTTAKAGTYDVVIDPFTKDDSNNDRYLNYDINYDTTASYQVLLADSADLFINDVSLVYGDSTYKYTNEAGQEKNSSLVLNAEHGTCGVNGSNACTYTYKVKAGQTNPSIEITNENTGAFNILRSGATTVTVTKPADDYYAEKTKDITVTITKKPITVTAKDQTLLPGDETLPSNEILLADGFQLAYSEQLSDFSWSYKYFLNGVEKTSAQILAARETPVQYDIIPSVATKTGGKSKDNYTWTIQDPKGKLSFVRTDQALEWDNATSYKKTLLIGESISVTARMLSTSTDWDVNSDFELDLGDFKDKFEVSAVNDSYTSTPADATKAFTGNNGKVSYTLKLKENAVFDDGDEVAVKVKKLASPSTAYVDSAVLEYKFKIYNPLTTATISPYDPADTDLSNSYGLVTTDTKLLKVTMDHGKPGDFNYTLEGTDAELFQIAAGGGNDCTEKYADGTVKDCAVISSKKLIDYRADKYEFTVKVENNKKADQTYEYSATKAGEYTVIKRTLYVKPKLSKVSIAFGEDLPEVSFEAVKSTTLVGTDVGKMGTMSYHFEDQDDAEVEDMTTAKAGTYSIYIDSFTKDDDGNERYLNYDIQYDKYSDFEIQHADSDDVFINDVSLAYGDSTYKYTNEAGEEKTSELLLNAEGGTCGIDLTNECTYTYEVVSDGNSDPAIEITDKDTGAFKILKAGSSTVKVTKPEDDYTKEATKNITITVTKKPVSVIAKNQLLAPGDAVVPDNEILLAEGFTLAYDEQLSDFSWTYKYLLDGVEKTTTDILAARETEVEYDIVPSISQITDGKSIDNYDWTMQQPYGTLSVTTTAIDDTNKHEFYTIDLLPVYSWYNKTDKLGIYPVNPEFSEMRVYLKNTTDGKMTIVRDYSEDDYQVDKDLCNGEACTFALRFRNPKTLSGTAMVEEILPIDNVLPEITALKWSEGSDTFAFFKSMFDDQYSTPAKVTVEAADETSGILDYSYVITEIDKNGKAIGSTTKITNVKDDNYTIRDKGYYKVEVAVRDEAHNTSKTSTTYVAIDDELPAQPTLEASVNGKTWDKNWTKEDISIKVVGSDKSQAGEPFHSEPDYYMVMKPGGTWEKLTDNPYTTSEQAIDDTYQFKTIYKNGAESAPESIALKIDKEPHNFSVDVKNLDGNAVGTDEVKGLIFTFTLNDTYLSGEDWYVYLAKEGSSEGAWKKITLSDTNTWTLQENFKGKIYFKNISEAGVSTEDDLSKLTSTPADGANVHDDSYLKVEATQSGKEYHGDWTNKPIQLKVSGGAASEADVVTYAFSLDGGTTWTNIKDMTDTDLILHSGKDTIVIQGNQEILADVQFKAIYSDTTKTSEIRKSHVQYDKVAPKAELNRTPKDELIATEKVTLEVVSSDSASSSPIAKYSFDGGTTWSDATGSVISKVFEETASNQVIVEDACGNQTTMNYEIFNINNDKPAAPVIIDAQKYVTGGDFWYNINQIIKVQPTSEGEIYYRIGNGAATKYDDTTGIEMSQEGRNVVTVWVKGHNGILSDEVSIDVNLDFTVPRNLEISYSDGNPLDQLIDLITGKKIRVYISAEDDLSGMAAFQYQIVSNGQSLNEANWKNGSEFPMEEDFDGKIYARAIDKAGNIAKGYKDGVEEGASLKIDATGPQISTIQDMTSWGNMTVANVRISDTIAGVDGDTFYYQLGDDQEVQGVLSDNAMDVPLKEGEYELKLRVSDLVGNKSTKTVHVMIDRTPVSINAVYTNDKAELTITTGVSELAQLYVANANGVKDKVQFTKTADGSYSASYTFTANGRYTFTAMNWAGSSASTDAELISGISDTLPIVAVKSSYVEGTWSGSDVSLSGTVINTANVETLEYRVDNDAWKPYVDGSELIETREGASTYHFIANRGLDTESNEASFTIKLDKTAPATPLIMNKDAYVADRWHNASQNVLAKKQYTSGCEEDLYYSLDNGSQWTKADNYTFLNEGRYNITFKAIDELGRSSESAQAIVNLDLSAPSNFAINVNKNQFKELINSISFGLFYNENVDVDFEADYAISGEGDTYYYVSDHALQMKELRELEEKNLWSKGDNFSITNDFKGVIYAKTFDVAGNSTGIISSDGLEVKFSGAILNAYNRNGNNWGKDDEVTITSSDFKDIKELSYTINTVSPTGGILEFDELGKAVLPLSENGNYSVVFSATDKFGNVTTAKINTKIDNVAPTVTIEQIATAEDASSSTLRISGSAGASGIQSVYLTNKKTGVRQYITLTSDNTFTYKAVSNAEYVVELTNGANVTATDSITISGLTEEKPAVSLNAVSDGAAYFSDTWTKEDVSITVSEAHGQGDVEFKVRDITDDANTAWENILPNDADAYVHAVSTSGIHELQFKVVKTDGTGGESDVVNFRVKISKTTDDKLPDDLIPDLPVEDQPKVDDPDNSDGNTNTSSPVVITPEVPNTNPDFDGIKKWVEYRVDNDDWQISLPITVTGDGIHHVYVRTKDELDRVSDEKEYIVVIDTTAPNNLAINVEDNSFKVLINNISFGTFYKDSKEAAISAEDAVTGVKEYQYQIVRDGELFDVNNAWESIAATTTFNAGSRASATVNLDKGFKGVVYARAIDNAGNVSNPISTDGIVIDYISPSIQLTHNMHTWAANTGVNVTLSDDLSGVKEAQYKVYSKDDATTPFDEGTLAVNDGLATVSELPNGEYRVEVSAVDKAGNTHMNMTTVKIDDQAPKIRSELKAEDIAVSPVTYKDIVSTIEVGPSGVKEVKMTSEQLGTSILKPDADGSYTYRVYAAGTYTFTVTANNGKSSTSEVVIAEGDIDTSKPVVALKGEYIADGSEYISDTWGFDGIRLIAKNLVTSLDNVTYQYYVDTTGTTPPDETSEWTTSEDGILRVYKNGTYYVRGFIKGEAEDGSDDIVGEATAFIVKLDLEGPKRVSVDNAANFTEDAWHDANQSVNASFVKAAEGADEWVEVSIDGKDYQRIEANPGGASSLAYSISIEDEGKHTVSFRSVDEAGRMSLETLAYVNIDKANTADGTLALQAVLKNKESDNYRDILLTPITGASGVKEIRLTANTMADTMVITPNEHGEYIYRAKADETYEFVLTAGNGKTANASVSVSGIVSLDPIIKVNVAKTDDQTIVSDYENWIKDPVTVSAENLNSSLQGSSITTDFYEQAGEGFSDVSVGDNVSLTTTGIHTYKVVMTYTDDLSVAHTSERIVSIKLDVDPVLNDITVTDETSFGADHWIGSSSNISEIEAHFTLQTNGCEEWIEYSLNQGIHWYKGTDDSVTRTLEDLPDDTYEIWFRTNDELDTGSKVEADYKKVTIQIDRSSGKLFHVEYQKISGVTAMLRSLITNENYEFKFDGNFDISKLDHIDYKIINDGEQFDVTKPKFTDTLSDVKTAIPVDGDTFNGKICGQGVDKAGNKTIVACSDPLMVDKATPEISVSSGSIPAEGEAETWFGTKNNATVTLTELPFSGFKEKSYTLKPTKDPADASDTREEITGELNFVKANDVISSQITGIPDGKWTMKVNVTSNTDAKAEVEKTLRIDTTTPSLKAEDWDKTTIVESFDLTLTPTTGVSGVDKITLVSAYDTRGAVIKDYTANSEISAVDGLYKVNITENGRYTFKITANNGKASYLKNVEVNNIKIEGPQLLAKAVTYSEDHTENVVPSDTWAPDRIELTFTLGNQDKIHDQVIWQYRNNKDNSPEWKDVVGKESGERTNKFSFDDDGVYDYSFRAKAGSLESDVYNYIAKVDTSGPSTPTINETGLEENVWHNSAQNVSASFVKDPNGGCDEFMEFRTYTKADDGTITIVSDWAQGDQTVINAEGKTYVEFRTYDELQRKSTTTTAIVVIDSFAPDNMTMSYETNTIKQWLNTVTFGNFYKDYIDVTFSATDEGDLTGANLTYYYVLVNKADVDAFDPYASDTAWIEATTNPISIAPNWEGLVYAKAKDVAGNETIVIRSDGISIDNVEPDIVFTPASYPTWSDDNSLGIHVSDDQAGAVHSGLDMDSITWSNNLTDDDAVSDEPLSLDADGNATLLDLVDGKYQITVNAKDIAGNAYSRGIIVKYDSVVPTLAMEPVDLTKTVYKETITLIPTVGGSGIKEFHAWKDGVESDLEIVTKIVDGKEVRTVDIVKNGFYEFSFTSGSGKESNKVSIQIENISDETPYIIAKGMTGTDSYTKGTWTDQNVEITVTTKLPDLYGLDLYYHVTKNGTEIAPKADDVTMEYKGITWIKFDGHLSVMDDGDYLYQFIGRSPSGKTSNPAVKFPVKIDHSAIPDVIVEKEAEYVSDAWFATPQNIKADFTDPNPEVRKIIEYNLDGEKEYGKEDLNWREGDQLSISANGKHTVIFRVRSDFGKVGSEKTIYVNIDRQTPSFTYQVTPKDGSARMSFTPTVGVSGTKSFTLTDPDGAVAPIVNNMITVNRTGTYKAVLTSNAGLSYSQDIEVKALSEVEPILDVTLSDHDGSDTYFKDSGLWEASSSKWADHAIDIHAAVTNADVTGNVKILVNVDNTGWVTHDNVREWNALVGDSTDFEGGYHYDIKAVSESGIESETLSFDVYVDKSKPGSFSVKDTAVDPTYSGDASNSKDATGGALLYKEGKWQNTSQRITTDFKQSADGSGEWTAFTITRTDGGKNEVIASQVRGNYYDIKESGIYTVKVDSMDELGRVGDSKSFEVRIDKERPSDLEVTVENNTFKSYLKKLTMGLFFKDDIEISANVNYGISEDGVILLQIVSDETEYDNDANSAKWTEYTEPITVDDTMIDPATGNFHKVIYFYAKDIAGNRTDVYRTDGITVDKVAPNISITVPNEGSWTSDNTVEISGSDANAIDAVKDLSGGLKEITFETDSNPVQSGKVQLDEHNKNTLTLADGTYDITVNAKDYAGNDANSVTKKVYIDTIAPTIEVSGHNDGVLAGSEILTIKTSVGVSGYQLMNPSGVVDNTGNAIIHVSVTTTDSDGSKVTTTSALNADDPYTVTQNGVYIFTVTNKAGVSASETISVNNISQEVSALKIMMTHDDGNGNQVIIDDDTWSATPVNITTTTDMISTIQYKVKSSDGKSTNWTNAQDGKLTISKDGTHTVSIRAVSASGSVSSEEQRIVKIDTEAPKAPTIIDIDDYDGWFSKARTVTAIFEEDVNGCAEWIQYSVNNGAWTDGDQVTITQPGRSSVAFRVMDELGRSTSGNLSSAEVKLDLSAPTGVKVELKNNDVTKLLNAMTFGNYYKETQDVYATADFSDSGVGYFEYQIVNKGDTFDDSTNWKRKSLSGTDMKQSSIVATLTSGFEGAVYVRAVDAAGNVSAIVNTNSVAIDDQAPVITMPKLADDEWLNDNNIAISITDDQSGVDWDSVSYSYQKGGKTFTGKVSVSEDGKTVFLPPLENGEYDLTITASDKAGNSASETAWIRLDTIKARIIDVTLDPEDVSANQVLIKAQIEDKSISGLDKVTIVSKTINETEMTPVDGEPGWYSFMANTNAVYTIKATTKAGLVSTRDVEITNIENTSPVLKITSVYTQDDKKNQPYTSGEWANANIDVTVANVAADIDVKEYYYKIEDLDGSELRATQTIDSSNGIFLQEIDLEGSYKVIFWCISEGGRTSDNVELLVNIDRSAPNVPSVSDADTYGIDDWTNNPAGRDVKATFEPTSGAPEWIEYNINDEWTTEHELYWRKVPANGIVNVNIEGTNKLIFRTVDATGRISSTTKEAYVNIDTTAPSDFFIKVEEKEYRKLINDLTFGAFFKDTVEVTIDGNFDISGLDRIEYQVLNVGETIDPDGEWKDYDGHFYISNDSSKVVYARGYDKAGNVTSIIRSDDITVETDAPIITYPDYTDNNTNGWITDNWLNVNVTDKISDDKAFSGVKEVTYTSFKGLDDLKGKADFLNDDAYLISNLPDGSYYLNILAVDQAGNEAHSYFGVAIDTQKPSFTVSGDRKTPSSSVTLNVLAKDIHVGASGVKEIKVNFNESDGTLVEQILKVDANGNYPFIAYENTKYTFTLTNGAGVSTTREVVITNIGEVETGIYVSDNVVENQWIKAENFSFDVWSEPRTNFLRYRMALNAETSGDYTDINDSTKQLQLNQSGKYSFDFETYDPAAVDDPKPMILSRNVSLWIDGDTPNAPVVIGDYSESTWYSGTQRIRAENHNTIVASDETIQYKVDDAADWTNGDSVEISDFAKHKVYFRIIDEVGHVSEITTAYVNMSDPSALSMRITAENTTMTSSAKMSIWPRLAQAPIAKLTVRNMDSADSSYHELDVRSVQACYNYFVTENGRYEVVLTDKAGNKAIQYVDFYNIQTAETKLMVTMKDNNNVTIKDNAWSGSRVTITAKDPSDETLALSKITYTIGDDTTPHVYAKPIKVEESGIQEYHFTLSRNGEVIETKDVQVKIDMETPLKPFIKDAESYGDKLWSNADLVKVQGLLDTSSPTPGSIEKLRYRVDDGEWINGEIARVRGDGEHTVTFVAYDEVGHVSAETSVKVNVDKVVPNIISIDKSEDKAHNTNLITITATDNHGVAKIYYKLVEQGVNADTVSYSESAGETAVFEIQNNFKGKIYAYAMDLAGNVSPTRVSDLINIDYSIPVITLPADHTVYTNDNTLSVSVNSGDSPLDPTSLKWVAKVTPTGKELASGSFSVDASGRGTITGLPNGSYRVYVSAANTAGNIGTNDTAVLIEHYETTITPTVGELSVDKRTQQITIEVTYGNDDNPALTSNLRPDKLYVKEGAIGEWVEVESYNAGLGKGSYNVNRNGIYTFKAVHSATQTNTISAPVEITAIEQGDDEINLDDYIKFAAPEDKGCGLAVDPIKANGTCTFTNYKNVTVNDVTILILNWDELNEAMSEQNLRLVQRIKLNNNSYPSDFDDVTWGDDTLISGAKVITSYRAADHYGTSYTYQFALMNEQDEIVGTDIIRRFGFSVTAGGDGRQKALLMSSSESSVLRMSAYTPIIVDEGLSYQIVEGTNAYDPNGWSESGEEITLGRGTYTLYTREVNGDIKSKELSFRDEALVSAETSSDMIRSFLKAITFNMLYQEDLEVKLNFTEELTNIEYNIAGTWNTYEDAIYLPREFTGEILVRAQGKDGIIVETLHLN